MKFSGCYFICNGLKWPQSRFSNIVHLIVIITITDVKHFNLEMYNILPTINKMVLVIENSIQSVVKSLRKTYVFSEDMQKKIFLM